MELLVREGEELSLTNKKVLLSLIIEELVRLFPTEFSMVGWFDKKFGME